MAHVSGIALVRHTDANAVHAHFLHCIRFRSG